MSDLKKVYQASSREIAENYLLELEEKWGSFGYGRIIGKICTVISSILKKFY